VETQQAHLATDKPAGLKQSRFTVKALVGGVGGAVLASLCCLPGAVALAVGAGVGTAASLFRLQDYQRLFQVAGLALALGWSWWLIRRSRRTCSVADHGRNRNAVPMLALGGFAVAFGVFNLLLIPWLERL